MNNTPPSARLVTAFGTALYVDVATGELRHGEIQKSPSNAYFVSDSGSTGLRHHGHLMYFSNDSCEPIFCLADRCSLTSRMPDLRSRVSARLLEEVPLERGLLTFRANNSYLSAFPDGRVALSAPRCSTWELFLSSEDSDKQSDPDDSQFSNDPTFDQKKIQSYIIHPLIRVRANEATKKKKILIYGYTKWSHGRVYYDLCKHLYQRGYIVDILDWQVNHAEYIGEIIPYYDLFMTACDGVRTLVDSYGIPYEKIIIISHHEFDLRMLIEQKGIEVFNRFANFGVVSESLYAASLMLGVTRVPMVASIGINFSEFYAAISDCLTTVGYAGSMSVNTYGVEWKRGELAEAAVKDAGLNFRLAGSTGNQISFHDMPDFYRTVDAVLTSSVSEGAGLPSIEAAAAGRLVISTPVGHFPRKAYEGGGIVAPIEAAKFKAFTTETLRYYKANPAAYMDKCREIQEAARKFDWELLIAEWIDLIETSGMEKSGFKTSSEKLAAAHQVHLINLDRSPTRLEKFKARNSHLNDILRVSAIDGAAVDKEQLVNDRTITEDLAYNPGSLGCALSHIGLWKKAAYQNRVVTIFEDDVICSLHFNDESTRILSILPEDWDIVHWGANFYPLFMWLDFGFSKAKLQFYDRHFSKDTIGFQSARYKPHPIRIAHLFGTQAYSVSPKGARALLEYCLPLRTRIIPFPGTDVRIDDTGIDCPMCGAYSFMQAFVCVPPLVIHDDELTSDRVEKDNLAGTRSHY